MGLDAVEKIVRAVIYEGYMLYPYRPSAIKNRQRWNFGVLTPRAYSEAQRGAEAWTTQTECLIQAGAQTTLNVDVRFLHLTAREVGKLSAPRRGPAGETDSDFQIVDWLDVEGRIFHTWQEATERDVSTTAKLNGLARRAQRVRFDFPARRERETLRDASGQAVGMIIRRRQSVAGAVEISVEPSGGRLFKLRVRTFNLTALDGAERVSRDEALMRSLVSTHTILRVQGGEFVSLLEPPGSLRAAAGSCRNVGCWPVLVGEAGERSCLLSSPIILYDYPQVASESAGDLFDATEIDELLTLRVLTLTDEEKREMRHADERARQILERAETFPQGQLTKLHGAVRKLRPAE
jgi:hydrogenase maturation protease